MQNNINVKPEVLQWARKSNQLDLQKASKLSKLSANELSRMESGEKKPNLIELEALAKSYKLSLASLLLYAPPKEKPLPKDRRTVNSSRVNVFDIKTIRAVEKSRALLYSFIELKKELGLEIKKFSDSATMSDNAKNAAEHFRKKWNLDALKNISGNNAALEGYIELVENLGAAVFQLSLTKDDLRGFSITDEEIPIIVIKRGNEPPTAKIFTLFHEVGHILLNDPGLCDMSLNSHQQIEKWCNSFAAEILVPEQELLNHNIVKHNIEEMIIEWSSKDLIEIGQNFFVGRLVILKKLFDLDLTTKKFYEEKLKAWNKPSFGRAKEPKGRDIPREIINERGKTFISLAFIAYERNNINLKELSDYLGTKLMHLPKIRQYLYEF